LVLHAIGCPCHALELVFRNLSEIDVQSTQFRYTCFMSD
jgi:hypothetical protein